MIVANQHHSPQQSSLNKGALAPTRARFKTNICVKNIKWQKAEDELLMNLMTINDRPNYSKLAESFPGKTGQQVAERWDKVLNPKLIKGSWTRQEDEIIVKYVRENGTKNWRNLCALLPGRIGKQCRERWRNHLDPNINHSPWTSDEDELLMRLHRQYGNHWVKISNMMSNRSDNAIKNRWNSTLKKIEVQNTNTSQLNVNSTNSDSNKNENKNNISQVEFVKPDFNCRSNNGTIGDDNNGESPASTPKLLTMINSPFGPKEGRFGYFSPALMRQKNGGTTLATTTEMCAEADQRPISLDDNRNALLEMIPPKS